LNLKFDRSNYRFGTLGKWLLNRENPFAHLRHPVPLTFTLLLTAFEAGEATWFVAVACTAIIGGALLASRELLRR
jgi:hypothetical protein